MSRWAGALACLTGLLACDALAGAERHLDDAAEAIRAAGVVADRAEPHLALAYEQDLRACLDATDPDACTTRVRRDWAEVRAALETVRAVRCAARPGACP